MNSSSPILVTGASGYIGGRLVPRLLERGYSVICPARSPGKLASRPWADHPRVTLAEADAEDTARMTELLRGTAAAYYLIHSMMAAGDEYAEHDRRLALSFAEAAAAGNCRRILYLGGRGETGENLSEHLASRREVETTLAATGVPVTVLRAAMIVGAGSASFEILRYLVERLPVMITPRWVETESQPIAVNDVLGYLTRALETPETVGRTLDIGGPDIVSYRQLMDTLAEARGLRKRLVIPVPVLTPHLSSLWIHLITPLSSHIARPLAEGLRNRVVCRDDEAQRLMPQELTPIRRALEEALRREGTSGVETDWSDAGAIPGDPDWAGGTTFRDSRALDIAALPERVFRAVCRIGGRNGWYAATALWHLRGWLDRLLGGPGLRRGRRDPEAIGYGDALDFWRVTGIERGRRLELRAEMKLPGEATLTFELEPLPEGRTRLTQTARFKPLGLAGIVYWYAVLPFHFFVFRGMLLGLRAAAEAPPVVADSAGTA